MHKLTFLLLFTILVSSCSSSKITRTEWHSDDFKSQQNERILIFANTEDIELQREFENEVAIILLNEGISPFKMHELFPTIEYKEEPSHEEITEFVTACKAKNIDKVLFATQKSVTVDTVHRKSLNNYMNSLAPLRLEPQNDALEYDTKEITTYSIEAAVYDINTTTEDKPIATTTLTATNPKSMYVLKKHLLKGITILFKDR